MKAFIKYVTKVNIHPAVHYLLPSDFGMPLKRDLGGRRGRHAHCRSCPRTSAELSSDLGAASGRVDLGGSAGVWWSAGVGGKNVR